MWIFDPRDWRPSGTWWVPHGGTRRRSRWQCNREVLQRWLATLALCFGLASLAPTEFVGSVFAAALLAAALASAALATIREERPSRLHLTRWDEAAWSLLASLGLQAWLMSP